MDSINMTYHFSNLITISTFTRIMYRAIHKEGIQ